MDYLEIITESLVTLTVNKLRTGLAILGIVIGIGSVIALMSLGAATQAAVQAQIQSLGANLLTVVPGAIREGAVRGAQGGGMSLTQADARALAAANLSTVRTVSPELSSRTQVMTGGANTNTQVVGVMPAYATVHKVTVESGSFITERDVTAMGKVAVIGPQAASDLFGDTTSPLGRKIRIRNQIFTIVGLTVAKGGSGFTNQDDIIFIPLSTAAGQVFGDDFLTSIAVEAASSEVMAQAQNDIGYFLLARHRISDPLQADFSIFSQQDILNAVSSTTGTFTMLLSGIAAISLLVGGIGIMNIMLVTVTERTREIGLRKALGAKKASIITQFLTEAVILTFAGGTIGVLAGIAASYLITRAIGTAFVLTPMSIVLAFAVSAGIGILFGWYPARLAANMQPIEALRYE